jgi:hypothetical protein
MRAGGDVGREIDTRLVGQQRRHAVEHGDIHELAAAVRSRAWSAIEMPCAANIPVTISAMATPSRTGRASANR